MPSKGRGYRSLRSSDQLDFEYHDFHRKLNSKFLRAVSSLSLIVLVVSDSHQQTRIPSLPPLRLLTMPLEANDIQLILRKELPMTILDR